VSLDSRRLRVIAEITRYMAEYRYATPGKSSLY